MTAIGRRVAAQSNTPPTLAQLCINALAIAAPPRALMCVLRRLPEELVMDLLERMILTNTITDDRLATFFTYWRRVLRLASCSSIRNSILRQIPNRCPQLRCLDLTNCAQVNNTVVRAVLQGCPSLQILRLDGCRHITDAAFQPDHTPGRPLVACGTLETISFARCSQLTGDLVLFLVLTCRSLKDVNFSRCKRLPSEAIRYLLRSTTHLERLTLSYMDMTDAAFSDLCDFGMGDATGQLHVLPRSLRAIDLTQSRVTDQTLRAIARRCRSLEDLRLSNCIEITDTGLGAVVAACPRLRTLDLNNCGLITDRWVSLIGTHGRLLEAVNLSWCMNMTDKGVVDLVRGCAAGLRQLKLVWCTQLTDVTMAALLEAPIGTTMALSLSGCKGISRAMIAQARARGFEVVAS